MFFLNDGSSGEWSSMVLYIKAKVPDLIKTSESSNYLFNFLASKTENSINKETVFAIKKDGRLFAPPKGLAQNIDNEDDTLPISQGAVKRLFESMRKNG